MHSTLPTVSKRVGDVIVVGTRVEQKSKHWISVSGIHNALYRLPQGAIIVPAQLTQAAEHGIERRKYIAFVGDAGVACGGYIHQLRGAWLLRFTWIAVRDVNVRQDACHVIGNDHMVRCHVAQNLSHTVINCRDDFAPFGFRMGPVHPADKISNFHIAGRHPPVRTVFNERVSRNTATIFTWRTAGVFGHRQHKRFCESLTICIDVVHTKTQNFVKNDAGTKAGQSNWELANIPLARNPF